MKDLTIIAETRDFVAVNKPSGLLSIPDRYNENAISVLGILKRKYPEIFVVHRLDRLTSGVLLFAKNADAHRFLSALFENRRVGKTYTGIVIGKLEDQEGKIEVPIAPHPHKKGEMIATRNGKASVTGYKVISGFNNYSVVNFAPITGRTHQIRVHAKYINHPLACDPVYGNGKPIFLSSFKRNYHRGDSGSEEHPLLSRLGLHASTLSFAGPTGKAYLIEAQLPKDMRALIYQLEKVQGPASTGIDQL